MTLRFGSWGSWLVIALVLAVLVASCAREIGDEPIQLLDGSVGGGQNQGQGMDAAVDGGRFGNPSGHVMTYGDSGFGDLDATTNPDAFFINDPPPPYCGPDPDMNMVETPTGTIACPSDKNREGCPCPEDGMQAPCWPGKRLNREHGICQDGMTTCIDTTEFGNRWGACEGYVLPVEGVASGPEACGCFSSGTWRLNNLSPCIFRGANTWLYSSILTADNTLDCGSVSEPPPVPTQVWSTSALNVDCAGQFRLCFTIKAGEVDAPLDSDCVVVETCTDVFYAERNVDQELPDLPAWRSEDTACAAEFDRRGGYGEMSVIGESVECDEIDDGSGGRYVFHRTNYCPPSCQQRPMDAECIGCRTGGSGDF